MSKVLTRLSAALLGLALVAAGIAGAVRYGVTYWLYRGFPAPAAPATVVIVVPGGTRTVRVVPATVVETSLRSPALGGWADPLYVVLPPGYVEHPWLRYPVQYLLHGNPGEPLNFLDAGDLLPVYEVLVATRRVQPMIIVMPSGSKSFFTDEEWANGVQPGNAWETFVASDLVEYIDAHYRAIPAGSSRGIAGLSEGGYASINIGLHHAGEFGLIESWSGYMTADDVPAIFGRRADLLSYNSPAFEAPRVAPRLRSHHVFVWFYDGTGDLFQTQNRLFSAELARLGVRHEFQTVPGHHSWALWRSMMSNSLIVASQHLSHG